MKDRWGLITKGLFPEVLPPCFTSTDLKRGFSGLVRDLKTKEFHKKRETDYVRYNGTKHDGSRRFYASPNPISYFYVASFIADQWTAFENQFSKSSFAVSTPRVGRLTDDRPVIIPSLSELTSVASKKLSYSSYVLKTDIAQFFPSLYTHAISWAAHGIDQSKGDQEPKSDVNLFNRLDFFVRNCQRAETRGVLVGPDAFRLIAEFVISKLDQEVYDQAHSYIVGAARHVDDYYVGVSSQPQALAALSTLRNVLQLYNFQINDSKTRTMEGVEPLNDVWAQKIRQKSRELKMFYGGSPDNIILFLDESLSVARQVSSDSPVKIALRTFDQIRVYNTDWELVENYLLRIMFHHSHCIDYIALLVAKRVAMSGPIDDKGWQSACSELIMRHLALGHHHEVVWLLWILIIAKLEISNGLLDALSQNENAHIRSLLIAAYNNGSIERRPKIGFSKRLASNDASWLVNLVARSTGFTKASFGGPLVDEFEHLASKKVRLVDFKAHMKMVRSTSANAISRTRYGYDAIDEDDDDDDDYDYDYDNDYRNLAF